MVLGLLPMEVLSEKTENCKMQIENWHWGIVGREADGTETVAPEDDHVVDVGGGGGRNARQETYHNRKEPTAPSRGPWARSRANMKCQRVRLLCQAEEGCFAGERQSSRAGAEGVGHVGPGGRAQGGGFL